ncbi:MAG: ABC transporter permease [Thermoplasmata archaeon]|nr:ABC transporter permease [Thermoplasmata archaeon]
MTIPAPLGPAAAPGTVIPKGGRPRPAIAQLKRTLYFLSRNALAMVGLIIVVFFVGVAVYSLTSPLSDQALQNYCSIPYGGTPLIGCQQICVYDSTMGPAPAPNCYPTNGADIGFVGPTANLAHLTGGPLPLGSLQPTSGSSPFYYSIYDGLLKGSAWSLGIAASIVVSGALIGLALGAIAGYRGGYTDEFIMRFTDIFLSIPGILLVLVIVASLGGYVSGLEGRILLLVGAFVITWWPFYTRIVRGQVLVTREQKYVEASRASGAKTGRILVNHIIPNSLYPVFVQLSLDVGAIPLLIGGLVFLGFNIFPTQWFPEWGAMSANSVGNLQTLIEACQFGSCTFPWWQIFFPGVTVFLFAISVNFLSDGLRDALDPRLRR